MEGTIGGMPGILPMLSLLGVKKREGVRPVLLIYGSVFCILQWIDTEGDDNGTEERCAF